MAITTFASLSDITPQYVREKYIGFDLVIPGTNPPEALPDSFYEQHINIAASIFERETDIILNETEIVDEMHDYLINDYQMFAFISLLKPPANLITKMAVRYPANSTDTLWPIEWARLQFPNQLQIVPTAGTLSQVLIGQSGSYLPIIYTSMGYLPQLFRISYKAGFGPGKLPFDILDAVCKLAVISIFSARSDSMFPPGFTSLSLGIDGLSQSFGMLNNGQVPAVFGSRIAWYEKQLYGTGNPNNPGFLANIKMRYNGIPFVSI